MPHLANVDLPLSLRRRLPEHAQNIYRSAFNNAWERYGDGGAARREEIAHRVAWSAVKKRYRKVDGAWIPRTVAGPALDLGGPAVRPLQVRRAAAPSSGTRARGDRA